MKKLCKILFFTFGLLIISEWSFSQPYVVMLSMDGFRWDYPEHAHTPNLDYLAAQGIKAHSIVPSFPSKTFPNHYTMATGLVPDRHGIVDNSFYDAQLGLKYKIGDRKAVENGIFYNGEPIWVTAEKQGIRSAALFWVGSEAPVHGIQPSLWKKYDQSLPFEQRIDTVIHWLSLPEEVRPHLLMWYFHEPDAIGHDYGPRSPEVYREVEYLDSLLGVFLAKLSQLPHAGEINLIVTSDHGMGPINKEDVVYLYDYLKKEWIEREEGGSPNFCLKAVPAFYDSVWNALAQMPHIQAWKHGQVPARLNYGTHPRTLDFIIVADSGWQITTGQRISYSNGAHGYDIANTDMHAIFYAMGPAFLKDPDYPSFSNTDLYILIASILGMEPAPTDGSFGRIKGMLRDQDK